MSGATTHGGRHRPDRTLRRVAPGVWLGGSPLRLFRLSPGGEALVAELAGPGGPGAVATTPAQQRLLDRLTAAGAAHPVAEAGAGPYTAADVTVVVPVRDRPSGLDGLLGALGPVLAAGGSVVVVDDGSADAAAHGEAAARHGARLVRRGHGHGPGPARNAGAALAPTPLLAFVDSDVTVAPGWLEPLVAHFADDGVGIVAPRVRSAPGAGRLAAYERRRSPLDLGPEPARVAPGTRVSYVPAAALVVRAGALRELGGFDEGLRWGEDVDFVWRAVEAGWRARYEPAAEVAHAARAGWGAWARQRFDYGSSAAELDARHPGVVAPVAVSPWSAAAWAAVAAGRPGIGAAVAAGSAAALVRKLDGVPPAEARRLAVTGHLGAGRQLARAGVRVWWPALLAASLVSRRARRIALACVAATVATTPGPAWVRAVAVADDIAYGAGVWRGVLRRRSARALLPRLPRWP